MGAAAFLIMQFLGVSYWTWCDGDDPTLLYYVGTFSWSRWRPQVRLTPPEASGKTVAAVMRTRGYHLISLIVLSSCWDGSLARGLGHLGILTTVLTSLLSKDRSDWLTPRRLWAPRGSAANMLPVAAARGGRHDRGTFSLTAWG